MDKKKLVIIAVVIIIAIVGVSMLFGGSSTKRNPDELIIAATGHGGELESGFDPMYGWAYNGEPLIQSSLFRFDNNRSIVNDLGTGYTTEDSKTWVATIRDDAKFSDGKKVTAEDVAFSFNTASKSEGYLFYDDFEKAEAINDTAVKVTLKQPQAEFLFTLARQPIVPHDYYDNNTYGSNPIGSGPYKLVQWDKGQQAIFELNEHYYGKKPAFKKLTILYYENDAAFAAAKRGELDMAAVPTSYGNQSVDGMELKGLPSYDSRYITLPFNNNTGEKTEDGFEKGNNVTADIAIRKAMYTGLNRQKLIDEVFSGYGDPDFTGVDKLPWFNEEAKLPDSNPEDAKKILKDGGWVDTDNDGIVEKNGQKASFTLLYGASDPDSQQLAIGFSDQMKEIGIEVIPEGKSRDAMKPLKFSNAVINGYGTNDIDPVYTAYMSNLAGQSYSNPNFYKNPTVDNYLNQSKSSSSLDETYNLIKLAAWDGNTGFGPKGDCVNIYIFDPEYLLFVDESLDIGTPLIQPHGCGDIYGNIYDWKRV